MYKDHKHIWERDKEGTRRRYFYLEPTIRLTKSGGFVLQGKKNKNKRSNPQTGIWGKVRFLIADSFFEISFCKQRLFHGFLVL